MTWIVATGWKNAKPIKTNGSSIDIRVEVKFCRGANLLSANTELHPPKLSYSTPVCHTCLLEECGTDVLNTDAKPTGILNLLKQTRQQYEEYLLLKRSWTLFAICTSVCRTNANHKASGPHSCPQFRAVSITRVVSFLLFNNCEEWSKLGSLWNTCS